MKQSDKDAIAKISNKELHRIAATCIIYKKDGTYLVTKRALHKKVQPGKWCVPGGGLSTDDYVNTPTTHEDTQWYGSVEKCLQREIKEETNVKIGKASYLLDITFISPNGMPCLVLSFYAPYVSGTVKLDADSVEYKWATLAEIKKLDTIPGIAEEVEMVEKAIK